MQTDKSNVQHQQSGKQTLTTSNNAPKTPKRTGKLQ